MRPSSIPFHRPFLAGRENVYLRAVLRSGNIAAGGEFTKKCEQWLQHYTHAPRVLLTHSCTNALELAAVIAQIGPDDEVIMPSFTFTSTANAFVRTGAIPVFIDIRANMNLDETKIEAAITPRTKAIVAVHYAGMACDMDSIMAIARRHNLLVIEDAAQGIIASFRDRPLGSIGHLGALSFHATKNLSCGEGGALVVNDPTMVERAEILQDKGTNRAQFRAGKIHQYDWVDLGLSAPPSELQAAVLNAQLEQAHSITEKRLTAWQRYQEALKEISETGKVSCPQIATYQQHNGHIYALIFSSNRLRDAARQALLAAGIQTALHYRPLHRSPAGKRFGRAGGYLVNSETLPERLLRLPLWPDLPDDVPDRIATTLARTVTSPST